MNKFIGHITKIISEGSISKVCVDLGQNILLQTVVIDTPETANYLKPNSVVEVMFKSTEVIISTSENNTSICNSISATVAEVRLGKLFSRIQLSSVLGDILCIGSAEQWKNLNLTEGSKVYALVNFHEILLAPK